MGCADGRTFWTSDEFISRPTGTPVLYFLFVLDLIFDLPFFFFTAYFCVGSARPRAMTVTLLRARRREKRAAAVYLRRRITADAAALSRRFWATAPPRGFLAVPSRAAAGLCKRNWPL